MMSKKTAKKALDDGKRKAKERLVEIDQMPAEWEARAAATDDPIIAAAYREQAATIARIGALEKESLHRSVEALERQAQIAQD